MFPTKMVLDVPDIVALLVEVNVALTIKVPYHISGILLSLNARVTYKIEPRVRSISSLILVYS